ncbi:helix-turn-helix domain-containing protein [Aquirufa antheringensis]|jgi:transcriptional regulator with XRE-family HTH domain|uniref:helix-turn-helix domain-containing protein n=1 Tax=Aquirufa antheringensis TaxID=2516559 RepID=UPI001F96EE23|nr:helix-turn-helix domain-containing protein [Aquirufa antheringensis]MCE4217477.1 helix-turn-helix domain-containing protein [Pseudarcicella sp. GAP-15]MCZ2477903.1 helix-turn-helix domain-containing protein [Aquirufa antheringensis]
MNFGEQLKEIRTTKGLTQIELSEKSGVALRTVQRMERNEGKPSLYSMNAIGEVLGTNLTLLYAPDLETETRNIMESTDQQLWAIARSRAKFKRSLGSYSIVIPFLWVIWFLTSQDKDINRIPWPIWPMLGWGIGLAIQYLKAYVIEVGSLEQREYDKLKNNQ